ncbi:LOW QUALITY PROTEIN: transposase, partial [Streptomyces viridosporus ATCC 14672]
CLRRPLGLDRTGLHRLASQANRTRHGGPGARPAGDRQRDPVCQPHRHPVGVPAARLPAVQDRLRLLRQVGSRRHHPTGPRPVTRQDPAGPRPQQGAHGGRDRRAEREDLGKRGRDQSGHRRRQEDQRTQAARRHLEVRPFLAVLVTAASVHDTTGGKLLLDDLATAHPTVSKVWADGGYQSSILNHGAGLGIDVEVVQRPRTEGFEPLPKRWVIERTFGWLMQHRRLARDYEALPQRSRAMIHWAMANKMSRELTGESAPTWRIETDMSATTA